VRGRGARREFDRFVDGSVDALLRTAYLLVGESAGAEDLVQECLLRLARRWPRVRAMAHPRAYARRVLVNLALDDSRRRGRQRAELCHDTDEVVDRRDVSAERAFGAVESSTALGAALARLTARQRATLVLRYFEDMTEAQTAEALGCSVGTVKSTTARALARLRTAVAPGWAGDEEQERRLAPVPDTKGATDVGSPDGS